MPPSFVFCLRLLLTALPSDHHPSACYAPPTSPASHCTSPLLVWRLIVLSRLDYPPRSIWRLRAAEKIITHFLLRSALTRIPLRADTPRIDSDSPPCRHTSIRTPSQIRPYDDVSPKHPFTRTRSCDVTRASACIPSRRTHAGELVRSRGSSHSRAASSSGTLILRPRGQELALHGTVLHSICNSSHAVSPSVGASHPHLLSDLAAHFMPRRPVMGPSLYSTSRTVALVFIDSCSGNKTSSQGVCCPAVPLRPGS